jgi:hypothetical protein
MGDVSTVSVGPIAPAVETMMGEFSAISLLDRPLTQGRLARR